MTNNSTAASVAPVTNVIAAEQQHMLLLFIPLKKGVIAQAVAAAQQAFGPRRASTGATAASASTPSDPRPLTGVHFFMVYVLEAGKSAALPMPIAGASVPTFQTSPDKDLLVVLSIYDADFDPYISAFFDLKPVVDSLNTLMLIMDESGLVLPTDPTSAISIAKNEGVVKNSDEFLTLLRRYNFADGRIPAATHAPVNTPANPKYFLGATFPGLTVSKLLSAYPDLGALYPVVGPTIQFDPATG